MATPAPAVDPQITANIATPRDGTASQVNSVLAVEPERSPEEVDAIFKDPGRMFLVVEDDIECNRGIVWQLNQKRGEENGKNVRLAETVVEAKQAIDQILQEPGITKVTLVLDMDFPYDKDQMSRPGSGRNVLSYIKGKIEERNTKSPENPVSLEIIMNSSGVQSQEDAEKLGAKRFSPEKLKAVETLGDYFANKPVPVKTPFLPRR